jgi:cell division protein FtsA
MEGLVELAEEVFHMPVRLGTPQYFVGMQDIVTDPIYSTGVGLLIYARQHRLAQRQELTQVRGLVSIWERMKSWFQGNF